MKESRKEFIKKAHSAACSDWKENIEKEFPKLFKKEEIYGWYKSKEEKCWCVFLENGISRYGFDSFGGWFEGEDYTYKLEKDDYKATDKEVEEALIKEAKKRGFKEGVLTDCGAIGNRFKHQFRPNENTFYFSNIRVFQNGKWLEIIKETITKEQAEKELGKTILT